MTKHFRKTACVALRLLRPSILPPLVLAADFIAVLTVSILVLWLIVVIPVRALAQEPQRPATPGPDIVFAGMAGAAHGWAKEKSLKAARTRQARHAMPRIRLTAARSVRT